MQSIDHLAIELHFPKNRTSEELRNRYAGLFPWLNSRSKVIARIGHIDGPTKLNIPHDLRATGPGIIFSFREFLADYRVEICTGQGGKALRSYFHGGGFFGDGACFSVPNSIVVVQATLQGELVPQTIRWFHAMLRGDQIVVQEKPLLENAFELPKHLERFALPTKLTRNYLLGSESHQPLYYDERDEFITGYFGKAEVPIYCLRCSKEHSIPIDTLLADREARLLLLRNYGYHGDLGGNLRSEVRDGTLPERLCPNWIKYHQG